MIEAGDKIVVVYEYGLDIPKRYVSGELVHTARGEGDMVEMITDDGVTLLINPYHRSLLHIEIVPLGE